MQNKSAVRENFFPQTALKFFRNFRFKLNRIGSQLFHLVLRVVDKLLKIETLLVLTTLVDHVNDAGYRCNSGFNDSDERLCGYSLIGSPPTVSQSTDCTGIIYNLIL